MAATKRFFMPALPFVKQHGIVHYDKEDTQDAPASEPPAQSPSHFQSQVYGPGSIRTGREGEPQMPARKLLNVHDPVEQQKEYDDIQAFEAAHRQWRQEAIRRRRSSGTILTGRHE